MITKLIVKDLNLLKRNLFFTSAIIFGLTWGITGISAENLFLARVFQGSSILFIIFFVVISIINHDEKSNADIILNSFPIKRHDLVAAKYLSTLMIILVSCFLMYIVTNTISLFPAYKSTVKYPTSIVLVIFIIGMALLYYGIYFPLYYYSIGKAKAINTFIYFLLIIIPNVAKKVSSKIIGTDRLNVARYMNIKGAGLILLIIGGILYYFSYIISKQIYINKEF